ncbi:MAG: hypothetical protein WBF53_16165, partial [Litorimonas sp.]
MTVWHWERWGRQGRPAQIVLHPGLAVEPATNPYKPLFAATAFLGFAAAGWMLRHLHHEEQQLATLDHIAQR